TVERAAETRAGLTAGRRACQEDAERDRLVGRRCAALRGHDTDAELKPPLVTGSPVQIRARVPLLLPVIGGNAGAAVVRAGEVVLHGVAAAADTGVVHLGVARTEPDVPVTEPVFLQDVDLYDLAGCAAGSREALTPIVGRVIRVLHSSGHLDDALRDGHVE